MKKKSFVTNKNISLFLKLDKQIDNNKTDKFNIKGLKIAKTFENIERWNLMKYL